MRNVQDLSALSRLWPLSKLPNFLRCAWAALNFHTSHCKLGYVMAYALLLEKIGCKAQACAVKTHPAQRCAEDAAVVGSSFHDEAEQHAQVDAKVDVTLTPAPSLAPGVRIFHEPSLADFKQKVDELVEQAKEEVAKKKARWPHRKIALQLGRLCGSGKE